MIEGGGIEVTDNIIIYAGNAPKEESWTYNSPKAYYQSNTYVNYQNTPEGDPAPICLSAATDILTAPGIAPETTNGSSRMYKGSQDFAGYRLKKRRHRPSETVNFRNKKNKKKGHKIFTKN